MGNGEECVCCHIREAQITDFRTGERLCHYCYWIYTFGKDWEDELARYGGSADMENHKKREGMTK